MSCRGSVRYNKRKQAIINELVDEAITGDTKIDTLPNTAQPLQGEVEAMYFKEIRSFMENSVSQLVMTRGQDIYIGECNG